MSTKENLEKGTYPVGGTEPRSGESTRVQGQAPSKVTRNSGKIKREMKVGEGDPGSRKEALVGQEKKPRYFEGTKDFGGLTDRLMEFGGLDAQGQPLTGKYNSPSDEQVVDLIDEAANRMLGGYSSMMRTVDYDKNAARKLSGEPVTVKGARGRKELAPHINYVAPGEKEPEIEHVTDTTGGFSIGTKEDILRNLERVRALAAHHSAKNPRSPWKNIHSTLASIANYSGNVNFNPSKEEIESAPALSFPTNWIDRQTRVSTGPLANDTDVSLWRTLNALTGKGTKRLTESRSELERKRDILGNAIASKLPGRPEVTNPLKTGRYSAISDIRNMARSLNSEKQLNAVVYNAKSGKYPGLSEADVLSLADSVLSGEEHYDPKVGWHGSKASGHTKKQALLEGIKAKFGQQMTTAGGIPISHGKYKNIGSLLSTDFGIPDSEIHDKAVEVQKLFDEQYPSALRRLNDPDLANEYIAKMAIENILPIERYRTDMGNVQEKNAIKKLANMFSGDAGSMSGVTLPSASISDLGESSGKRLSQKVLRNIVDPAKTRNIEASKEARMDDAIERASTKAQIDQAIRNARPEQKESRGVSSLATFDPSAGSMPETDAPVSPGLYQNIRNEDFLRNAPKDETPTKLESENTTKNLLQQITEATLKRDRAKAAQGLPEKERNRMLQEYEKEINILSQKLKNLPQPAISTKKSMDLDKSVKGFTSKLKAFGASAGLACGLGGCGSPVEQSGNYKKTSVEGKGPVQTKCYENNEEVSCDDWNKGPVMPSMQGSAPAANKSEPVKKSEPIEKGWKDKLATGVMAGAAAAHVPVFVGALQDGQRRYEERVKRNRDIEQKKVMQTNVDGTAQPMKKADGSAAQANNPAPSAPTPTSAWNSGDPTSLWSAPSNIANAVTGMFKSDKTGNIKGLNKALGTFSKKKLHQTD